MTRVKQLDAQWMAFVNLLGSNYRKQKERYLQQRKEAVETVKSRKKKWDEVQAEIKQLTNQGGATKETTTEAVMEPDMEADALMPWDEAVEIPEDTSLEEQDLQMEPPQPEQPDATSDSMKPFRGRKTVTPPEKMRKLED